MMLKTYLFSGVAALLIAYLFGLFTGLIFFSFMIKKYQNLGQMSVAYAILLLFLCIIINHQNSDEIVLIYQDSFIFDLLSKYGSSFLCLLTIICLLVSETYLKKVKMTFEYTFILLFALFGLCLLLSAYDFLAIYLAIELQSLASYVLASIRRDSANSVEAGLKYFILGSFASGLFVFGMSLIYALTGIHDLNHLGLYLSSISFEDETSIIVIFGLLLMFSGLIFKIGGAPFHMWVADVYEGAPSSVTIFFMVVPKIALFGFFLRLCHFSFMDASYIWVSFFVFSSILSLIFGSLGALSQVKIKRLFAFSSIDNVGYMLIGLASIGKEGENAVITYLIIYSIGNLLFWSFFLSSYTLSSKKTMITYITDLSGLAKINILLGIVLSVSILSLAGIPPFAGFFAKMSIIRVAIDSDLYLVSFGAILGSMVSLFYYLRIVKIIFWDTRLYYSFTLKLYYIRLKKNVSYIISLLFFFLLWYITLDPAMETLCRSLTQCEGSETNKESSKEEDNSWFDYELWNNNRWIRYTVYICGTVLVVSLTYALYLHAHENGYLPDCFKFAEEYHLEKLASTSPDVSAAQKLESAIWIYNKYADIPELVRQRVIAGETIVRLSNDPKILCDVADFVTDPQRCKVHTQVSDRFWNVGTFILEYFYNQNNLYREFGYKNLDEYLEKDAGVDRSLPNWQIPGGFLSHVSEDGFDPPKHYKTYDSRGLWPETDSFEFHCDRNQGFWPWCTQEDIDAYIAKYGKPGGRL